MSLQTLRYKVENLKGQQHQLKQDMKLSVARIATLKQEVITVEEAKIIIQTVAQETQRKLEYHISEMVSLALSAVFENPYRLVLEFVLRRNRTEADIFFERGNERIRPIDAAGGGVVDIAAFALRVAMWSLRRPRSRNVLITDEPFRMVSEDLRPKAAAMVAEISKRLGLQMLIITHAKEFVEVADKLFTVEIHGGVSYVKEDNKNDQNEGHIKDKKSSRQSNKENSDDSRPDNRDTKEQQHHMDVNPANGDGKGTSGDQQTAQTNHSKRPQGVPTHGTPRRRRT